MLKALVVWAFCSGGGGSAGARGIDLRSAGQAGEHYDSNVSNFAIVYNNCLKFVRSGKHCAFTMAEILLSLTIIGVVAAITLPSLTGNINERTWNTQRKALYARFSQAIALMPSLNGYGTLTEGDSSTSAIDTAAETFVTEGLAKVMKINNICDNEHLEDCGMATSITNMIGSQKLLPTTMYELNGLFSPSYAYVKNTKAAAFETQNGESIIIYYNPQCIANAGTTNAHHSQPLMCANFIYDLNGTKGPNTMGKDIGLITALYSSDPVIVSPMPLTTNVASGTWNLSGNKCKALDPESRMPNIDELSAMFYNTNIIGLSISGDLWSGTVKDSNNAWSINMQNGYLAAYPKSGGRSSRCIKR